MFYLIKSAAFYDEKDNRFKKYLIDPLHHLEIHLNVEDEHMIYIMELI